MSFGEAIAACFRKYATFSGRAKRPEYWYFYLFLIIVGLVLGLIDGVIAGVMNLGPDESFGLFGGIFNLATIVPLLAVGWRRLHDVGKPGYFNFLPLIGLIPLAAGFALEVQLLIYASIAVFIGLTILLIVWLASPSQPGANRYGGSGDREELEQVFS